uniref:Uncharacterized protein n=1 Tax=Globodera pallida TaxID=36090 RepID=A0A183BWW6_GLOPA
MFRSESQGTDAVAETLADNYEVEKRHLLLVDRITSYNVCYTKYYEKAPGLLEENGGQVKLKITWAMKLVTRVQEREREIQLGLPAGSLQNLPRSAFSNAAVGGDQQQSSASSALVNELLGQNLMGNQQIDVNALLAAAAAENPQQIDLNDAAVLNLLGMAAGGSDLFSSNGGGGGTGMSHEHPGCTSTGVGGPSTSSAAAAALQQQQNQRYKQELAESDEAIRQLLSSLQGGGAEHVGGAVQHQHQQRARDGAAGGKKHTHRNSQRILKINFPIFLIHPENKEGRSGGKEERE